MVRVLGLGLGAIHLASQVGIQRIDLNPPRDIVLTATSLRLVMP
jgi:hypothetical protein